MPLLNRQLSFAAGSSSLDPYGYRTIGPDAGQRMVQIANQFPSLRRFLNSSSLIVNAYPAALGLTGVAPMVDTYLHPETFIRSMTLAATEMRSVIMVAQPLAGADLLVRLCRHERRFPKQILWAAGGYYFPASLERYASSLLRQRGCRLTLLHSYGVAEIGHSCFAAVDRFPSGLPKFKMIAREVNQIPANGSEALILERNGRCINTGDTARQVDGHWRIDCSPTRIAACVRETLETWTTDHWARRTGYLNADANQTTYQLREGTDPRNDPGEVHFHKFWHLHGGSLTTKPRWNRPHAIASSRKVTAPDGLTTLAEF